MSKKQNTKATKAELHRVSRTQVIAGSPAVWANRLAHTLGERDKYKAQAQALAEALRSLLYATDHIEHIRAQLNKATDALGNWEAAKQ